MQGVHMRVSASGVTSQQAASIGLHRHLAYGERHARRLVHPSLFRTCSCTNFHRKFPLVIRVHRPGGIHENGTESIPALVRRPCL